MKFLSPTDWGNLIALTPNTPENQQLLAALAALQNDASVLKKSYFYNAIFSSVPTSGTVTQQVNVDAAAPFLVLSMALLANNSNASQSASGQNVPNVGVTIVDTGSNQQWMDQSTPLPNIFGNGQWPFVLPEPRLIPANSGISVTLASFEAANTPNIRLSFIGYKLYSLAG